MATSKVAKAVVAIRRKFAMLGFLVMRRQSRAVARSLQSFHLPMDLGGEVASILTQLPKLNGEV
jgi:hypothetical protein